MLGIEQWATLWWSLFSQSFPPTRGDTMAVAELVRWQQRKEVHLDIVAIGAGGRATAQRRSGDTSHLGAEIPGGGSRECKGPMQESAGWA